MPGTHTIILKEQPDRTEPLAEAQSTQRTAKAGGFRVQFPEIKKYLAFFAS